jgi:phage-related protein
MGHRLSGIYYFIDKKGNSPVEEFLNTLPAKEQCKIFAYLVELQQQGYNLRRPMADYLCHGIYELRPKDNRIFYFFFLNDTAVLLHAIKKKRDKIPENDLRLCLDRKTQVEKCKNIERIEL